VFGFEPPLDEWMQEEAIEPEILVDRIRERADADIAAKMEEIGPELAVQVEKSILLQSLDHHWKEHLSTLDALRQVIHLRAYAQRKPIDEYKHEAFALFERMLGAIREDVTRTLSFAQFSFQMPEQAAEYAALPDYPDMPDFVTHHIDPFTGDDDTADIDAETGAILSRLPPLQMPQPEMPQADLPVGGGAVDELTRVSRNAPCPCGSGRKYKHCHGAL
jgi:preprotein translocase subunit SecA